MHEKNKNSGEIKQNINSTGKLLRQILLQKIGQDIGSF